MSGKRKNILLLIVLNLSFSLLLPAASPADLFAKANALFLKGDFKNATQTYEEIIRQQQMMSPALYYNLGNCYYKLTDYPNAILNYERALKYQPGDQDVLFNLRLANQRIEDKIEVVPELFYYRWFNALRGLMEAGSWAALSLMLLTLTAAGCYLYFLSTGVAMKKTGFYGALLTLLLSVACFTLGWSRYRITYAKNEAIIFSGSVSVKSAPTGNSTGLFLLHAGSKVKISDELEGWVKVKTYDGNEGWMLKEDLEII
jgi:tetratricopeptide (TPR) repeat protein